MNLKEENDNLREILRRVYSYVPIPEQVRIDSVLSEQDGNEVASPAQDDREATAVPEGWLIELGFDVLDRPFRFVDSKSHTPTIKVILPACEPDDSSSWDLRDEIARHIGSALATRPAQTGQQPEQSETVLVPVSVIEEAAHMLEAHSPGSGSVESFVAQDLRSALSAQGCEVG